MKQLEIINVKPSIDLKQRLKKKKVCAYCRISSTNEHQLSSIDNQYEYYTKLLSSNPNYEFIGIFGDERTGTSIEQRKQFNLMIELARMREIDIIYTKSISRFGRNLVDTLSIIHEMRELGVVIYFEKENLRSCDTEIDFYLSILSSVAEEESKQISSNCNWSIRKRMKEGKNLTFFLYGYSFENGEEYKVVEEEAKNIRFIFYSYVNGTSTSEIAKALNTKEGGTKWTPQKVLRILTNEKYAGHVVLQKNFTTSVGKHAILNFNQAEKYFIKNDHTPIVPDNIFQKAQAIKKERAEKYKLRCGVHFQVKNSPTNKLVYYSPLGIYLTPITNRKNTSQEAKFFGLKRDQKRLNGNRLYFSCIEKAISLFLAQFLNDPSDFKDRVFAFQKKIINGSKVNEKIYKLEEKMANKKARIDDFNKSDIPSDAKSLLLENEEKEYSVLSQELSDLKLSVLTEFNYKSKLDNYVKSLTKLKDFTNFEFKSVFQKIILIDRENIILCIHLSNKELNEIDLNAVTRYESIYEGSFDFTQTRLKYKVNYKVKII